MAEQVTAAELESGLLYPPQSNILETEMRAAVSVAEAINQCHSGNPDAGIATLSRMLKDQDFTLPPRPGK